jgi:plastocyanin
MWTNKDSVSHTTAALDGTWDSGIMRKGHSFSQTFDSTGKFNYRCDIHPTTMKGTIIVE